MSAAWETNTDKIRDRKNTWESGWEYSILFLGLKNKRLFVLWHTISSDFVVFVLVVVCNTWKILSSIIIFVSVVYTKRVSVCSKWQCVCCIFNLQPSERNYRQDISHVVYSANTIHRVLTSWTKYISWPFTLYL